MSLRGRPGMLDQFNATIDKLYGAAVDRRRWDEAFTAVEQLTDCAGMVINLVSKGDASDNLTMFGPRVLQHGAREDVDEYDRDLIAKCPRVAAGIAYPDAPYICDHMILTEAEMDRDPVYDWHSRHGLRYFVGSVLGETPRHRLMWSLQRTPAQGHVGAEDIRRFELLKPHVRRALTLAEQVGTLRSFQRFSSAVLDCLPNALFALGADGCLLFANAAARLLLERGDGIQLADGRLRARSTADQARLDRLIRQALAPAADAVHSWALVSRADGGLPYATFVSPLNVQEDELLAAAAKVLVVVHDVGRRVQPQAEIVRSVFGLTEAEARLACALVGGHSIESAAALLRIKPSTVRSHLKSVFRKVGVNRQQDLVQLVAKLSSSPALP
ncbi:MAG TPA: helix-turn-helix transcriptional regulator [Sphingomicrobium sp.]